MSDSDDEYVNELSDDDNVDDSGQGRGYATRIRDGQTAAQASRTRERWEDIQRSWDLVTEGADGSLAETVEGIAEAEKRKRLLRDTTPLQRGIIRHMVLILDLSISMAEKDLRPTRYLLTIRHATIFVTEFFEQNPISQLAILGMREGICVRVSDMGGNPNDHITALQNLRAKEPKGSPSLQNALEMARGALFHAPSHGTREVLIVFGALLSSDPGDIHTTIRALVTDAIRVSVVGLAARIAICTELVARTNGLGAGGAAAAFDAINRYYGVAMHEMHFRDLLLTHTTPPPIHSQHSTNASSSSTAGAAQASTSADPSLLIMGFPSRTEEPTASLCACHSKPSRGGYRCSRCHAKVCALPAQCPVCDLQLIQSTHLARSYHHLFPLRNYVEVPWAEAYKKLRHGRTANNASAVCCFACLTPFPPIPDDIDIDIDGTNGASGSTNRQQEQQRKGGGRRRVQKGASESWRYACENCGEHFCIDCDVFAHEVSHNCAGCLCTAPKAVAANQSEDQANGSEDFATSNGNGDVEMQG